MQISFLQRLRTILLRSHLQEFVWQGYHITHGSVLVCGLLYILGAGRCCEETSQAAAANLSWGNTMTLSTNSSNSSLEKILGVWRQ